MHRVDEELAATGVGLPGVGHGQRVRLIGQLGAAGLTEFVRNASLAVPGDGALAGNLRMQGRQR